VLFSQYLACRTISSTTKPAETGYGPTPFRLPPTPFRLPPNSAYDSRFRYRSWRDRITDAAIGAGLPLPLMLPDPVQIARPTPFRLPPAREADLVPTTATAPCVHATVRTVRGTGRADSPELTRPWESHDVVESNMLFEEPIKHEQEVIHRGRASDSVEGDDTWCSYQISRRTRSLACLVNHWEVDW
jgi:hypothetical protein